MSKLILETNVRLKASIEYDKETFDKVIEESYEGSVKKLEQKAKEDFIRALKDDLGFKDEEINVTKFVYRLEERDYAIEVIGN